MRTPRLGAGLPVSVPPEARCLAPAPAGDGAPLRFGVPLDTPLHTMRVANDASVHKTAVSYNSH